MRIAIALFLSLSPFGRLRVQDCVVPELVALRQAQGPGLHMAMMHASGPLIDAAFECNVKFYF